MSMFSSIVSRAKPTTASATKGHDNSTAVLPIDIRFDKLVDWLQERGKLRTDYGKVVKQIRLRINAALTTMPDIPEVIDLIKDTYLNYYHAVQILDLLKASSEGESRNIFGMYSSTHIKDWKRIVSLYEKGCVYLGECSQILTQDVVYEVPLLKKQLAKYQQQLQELNKKESEYKRSIKMYKEHHQKLCRDMTIAGINVREELSALVLDFPNIFENLADQTRTSEMEQVIAYYSQFVRWIVSVLDDDKSCPLDEGTTLPMLRYVSTNGNTSIKDWLSSQGQEPIPDKPTTEEQSNPGTTIDWGITLEDGPAEGSGGNDSGINWDISLGADSGAISQESSTQVNPAINWEIDVDDTSSTPATIDWAVDPVEDNPSLTSKADVSGDSLVFTASEAQSTVLEDARSRSLFVNDILELQVFLTQRLEELNTHQPNGALQSAPIGVQGMDMDTLTTVKTAVDSVISSINSARVRQLLLIKSSDTFLERITFSITRKMDAALKLEASMGELAVKRESLSAQIAETGPKLASVIQRVNDLQALVEGSLSNLFAPSPVNLIGDINTL